MIPFPQPGGLASSAQQIAVNWTLDSSTSHAYAGKQADNLERSRYEAAADFLNSLLVNVTEFSESAQSARGEGWLWKE